MNSHIQSPAPFRLSSLYGWILLLLMLLTAGPAMAQPQRHLSVFSNKALSFHQEPPVLQSVPINNRFYPINIFTYGTDSFVCGVTSYGNGQDTFALLSPSQGPLYIDSSRFHRISTFLLPKENGYWFIFSKESESSYSKDYFSHYKALTIEWQNGLLQVTDTTELLSFSRSSMSYTALGDSSYWLSTLSWYGDTLYSWKVTPDSISPRVSTVIPEVIAQLQGHQKSLFLYLKYIPVFNWKGTQVVFHVNLPLSSVLFLCDFDRQNGRCSNCRPLETVPRFPSPTDSVSRGFWGINFSPNDSLLYYSAESIFYKWNPLDPIEPWEDVARQDTLWQVPVFSSQPQLDRVPVGEQFRHPMSDHIYLQHNFLGANGRLYWASSRQVAEIQQPNKPGSACRFVAVDSISSVGGWVQHQFEYLQVRFRHQRQCAGVQFQQDCDSSFTDFHWYFSRPGGGFDTASGASVTHAFPASGRYFVKLKASRPDGYFAWWSDTVLYLQPPVLSSTDTTRYACRHAQTTYTLSIAQDTVKHGANKLTVSFGDGHDTTFTGNILSPLTLPHTYRDTGTYTLTAIYTNGFCADTLVLDSVVTVVDAPRPGFALSQNKGCAPLEITVTDQSQGFVSTWHYAFGTGDSASTASPTYTYEEAGLHWLVQSLLGPSGCLMKDSQQVWVAPGVTAQDTVQMTRVTVTDSGFVQVAWQQEPRVQQYTLVRQPPFAGGEPFITTQTAYLDSLVETSEQSYRYHLTGQDSCGKSTTPSPAHATILLGGKSRGNDLAQLQWSAYQGWPVQRYHLWKGGSWTR